MRLMEIDQTRGRALGRGPSFKSWDQLYSFSPENPMLVLYLVGSTTGLYLGLGTCRRRA